MGMNSKIGVGDNVSVVLTKGPGLQIAICSDLHLEFGPITLVNPGGVEVLILSGDILVANDLGKHDSNNLMGEHTRSAKWHKFFQECSANFPQVIYVAGNHEHYHGDFATTIPTLKESLAYLPNVHVLNNETFEHGGAVFAGTTLWTDMNKGDPQTLFALRGMMNDFRRVKNSNRMVSYKTYLPDPANPGQEIVQFKERVSTFCPEDAMEEHRIALEFIAKAYDETPAWKHFIVCGHHTPSFQSCNVRYNQHPEDQLMNGGYHSNLTEFILDRPSIKLWTHGHTHERYDYQIGDTRIVGNPRGYVNHESIADSFELKVVSV
jgi:predicted phosphodiesterase